MSARAAVSAQRARRTALEERYQTHDGCVRALTDAANALVKEGYLLPDDAAAMIAQATTSSVLR